MAEQTSRLAIIIDSTGAKNNADNLTSSLVKMTQAGETAANSAGKVTKEGANKRGNSSRLTQSFHFFMFEPIFSPVNALNQPI